MSTLHTVNKSPFEKNAMQSCLAHLKAGDAVLLIEDGVLGLRQGTAPAAALGKVLATAKVYGLAPDLSARGIKQGEVIAGVELVDYAGFVDLVAKADRTVAWL